MIQKSSFKKTENQSNYLILNPLLKMEI